MENMEPDEEDKFLIFVKEIDPKRNKLIPKNDIYLDES